MPYDKQVKGESGDEGTPGHTPGAPSSGARGAGLRWVAADIVAMVLFSTAVGMAIELGVAGLTLAGSLRARAIAIPINLGTGRPYGAFRDRVLMVIGASQGRRLRTAVADTVAFVCFQIPLYATVLLVSGASVSQAAIACLTMSGAFAVSGRPFGIFLDAVRHLFRVDPHRAHQQSEETLPR